MSFRSCLRPDGSLRRAGLVLKQRVARSIFAVGHSMFHASLVMLFAAEGIVVLLRNPVWQDSDGLIGALSSLQHMTLFYWGQDRFANFIPALAIPFNDPLYNVTVQVIFRTAFGIIAPLFACMFLTRTMRDAWLATLLATALFLMCGPHTMQHEAFIQASPYGTSFALAGMSLLMFRHALRMRLIARTFWHLGAAAIAVTAYFVNYSLFLVTAPISSWVRCSSSGPTWRWRSASRAWADRCSA